MRAQRLRHVEPDGDDVQRLHAIGPEVESNLIRLLRLMLQPMVKSGTVDGAAQDWRKITPCREGGKAEEEPGQRNDQNGDHSRCSRHGACCTHAEVIPTRRADRFDRTLRPSNRSTNRSAFPQRKSLQKPTRRRARLNRLVITVANQLIGRSRCAGRRPSSTYA